MLIGAVMAYYFNSPTRLREFLDLFFELLDPLVQRLQMVEDERMDVDRVHADGAVGGGDFFDDRLQFPFGFHGGFHGGFHSRSPGSVCGVEAVCLEPRPSFHRLLSRFPGLAPVVIVPYWRL